MLVDLLGPDKLLAEYGGEAPAQPSITQAGTFPTLAALRTRTNTHSIVSSNNYDGRGGGGGSPARSSRSSRYNDEPMTPTSDSEAYAWSQVRRRHKKNGRNGSQSSSRYRGSKGMATSSESSFKTGSSVSRSIRDSMRSRSARTAKSERSAGTFSVNSDAFESCVPSMLESGERGGGTAGMDEAESNNVTRTKRSKLRKQRMMMRRTSQRGKGPLDYALKFAALCFLKLPGAASLLAKDLSDLCRVHYILSGFAEVLALCTLALGVYWMEIMISWTSQLIQAVMWSGVLLVTLGALEMTFGFMGISAVQTKCVGVVSKYMYFY